MNKQYIKNFLRLMEIADKEDVEWAKEFYPKTNAEIVSRISNNLAINNVDAAGVLSAFTPQTAWDSSVVHAIRFSKGIEVRTLPNNIKAAERVVRVGADKALKGPKTRNFTYALVGNPNAVPVDTHIARCAAWDHSVKFRNSQYDEHAEAMKYAANEFGIEPRAGQALVWKSWRING